MNWYDAHMSGAMDVKFQNRYNYLLDLLSVFSSLENEQASAVAGTATKITWNTKGLVIGGGDAFAGYTEPVSAPTGTSRELDTTAFNVFRLDTFTAETTITFATPDSGTRAYSMTVWITQTASPQTINMPTISWNGDAPTLTDASTTHIISFGTIDDGATWYELGRGVYT
jgi:hypothetical protein